MKCTYGKAVQWKDGEADLTGVLVRGVNGEYVTEIGSVMSTPHQSVLVQVAHGCTRELEFVEFGKLSDYPSEAIEEPTR